MHSIGYHFWIRKAAVILVGVLMAVFMAVSGVSGRTADDVIEGNGAVTAGLSAADLARISAQLPTPLQQAKLSAGDAQSEDFFGSTLALDGDTVVVGAFGERGGDGDPLYHAGAAYIFERNHGGPDNWGQVTKLTASDAQFYDEFGMTVAINGDTVAVGAPHENGGPGNPLLDAGAVYIFERNQGGPNNWGEVKILRASAPDEEDDFGFSLALSGDTLMVGTPGEDDGPPTYAVGAVYFFERNQGGPNNWGEVKILRASDADNGDGFGIAVALSGDTLVVGAPQEDGSLGWAGAAYVFERNQGGANNWGEVTKLVASDAGNNDRLGSAVTIDGDTLVVAAPFEDGGPGDPMFVAGAIYVFERNQGGPNNWGEVVKLAASDPAEGDLFGTEVLLRGDTLLAATPSEGGGPEDPLPGAGAVYVFERNQGGAGNWGEVVKLMADDAEAGDNFGASLAIHDSGFFLIGALRGNAEGPPAVTNSGVVYIFNLEGLDYSLYLPVVQRR